MTTNESNGSVNDQPGAKEGLGVGEQRPRGSHCLTCDVRVGESGQFATEAEWEAHEASEQHQAAFPDGQAAR